MEILNLEKCWVYNELADIPDEFIIIEKNDVSMFDDLHRILLRKNWIKDNDLPESNEPKENVEDKNE